MTASLLLPVALFFINNLNSDVSNGVEAKTHEIGPMHGWFRNFDTVQKEEEAETPIANDNNFAEFPNIKRRKLKTKNKAINIKAENGEISHEAVKKKKKNRRKRKKKTAPKRFVKTMMAENDKDSNMTSSKEPVNSRGKPVDIIVHIKMSE